MRKRVNTGVYIILTLMTFATSFYALFLFGATVFYLGVGLMTALLDKETVQAFLGSMLFGLIAMGFDWLRGKLKE